VILIRIDSVATAVASQYPGIGRLLGEFDPKYVNGFIGGTIDGKVADEIQSQLDSRNIAATVSVVESDDGLSNPGSIAKMGLIAALGILAGYVLAKKG